MILDRHVLVPTKKNKSLFQSSQILPYLQFYSLTSHYQQKPALFQRKNPLPFAVQMQVMLVENSETSTFRVLSIKSFS